MFTDEENETEDYSDLIKAKDFFAPKTFLLHTTYKVSGQTHEFKVYQLDGTDVFRVTNYIGEGYERDMDVVKDKVFGWVLDELMISNDDIHAIGKLIEKHLKTM